MNFTFEINTTASSEPIYLSVNSSKITLKELRNQLFEEVEKNTSFTKDDILEFFAQDLISTNTMTIPNTNQMVKDFIPMNRTYFPLGLVSKNTYKLYAIDREYREKVVTTMKTDRLLAHQQDKTLDRSSNPRSREIKTNHFDDILNFTRKFVYI